MANANDTASTVFALLLFVIGSLPIAKLTQFPSRWIVVWMAASARLLEEMIEDIMSIA